jgi:tetratricopeptide (TPR) repeat protein
VSEVLRQREAALRAEAKELAAAGRLEEAAERLDQCVAIAEQVSDEALRESAACHRAYLAVILGDGAKYVPFLREVLLRNGGAVLSWQAAYGLAYFYELAKEFRKSAFYAQIAIDRARNLGNDDWLAGSLNQLANARLASSSLVDAARLYQDALALEASDGTVRGMLVANLGYARLLAGETLNGVRLLVQGLRILRRNRARVAMVQAHLDLSHGYLELGRWRAALRHAVMALREAQERGFAEEAKNAFYLAGEAARLGGDLDRAEEFFRSLQKAYYPAQPYLSNLLMAVDVRAMVNLHA